MIKVLFVCHGNICRSPMAEFMFKDMLKREGLEDKFIVESRATSSEEIYNGIGNKVHPLAQRELAKHNIYCPDKRAIQLTLEDYNNFDYILAADSYNIKNILRLIGKDPQNKVKLLLEYGTYVRDISDPYYTGDFKQTYDDILEGLNGFLTYLKSTNIII